MRIKSSNKNLLDILNKNPNSELGMYLTKHKNGVLVGNVINENEYHCTFYDTKHSYTDYSDNQIDFKSLCDPRIYLHTVNELFGHLIKDRDKVLAHKIGWLNKTIQEVDTEPCEIVINNFWIDSGWFRDDVFLLSRYMDNVTTKTKGVNLAEITIKADTIFDAMNTLAMVSFISAVTNGTETLFIDDALLGKAVRILGNVGNIPYFVYYLFIKRVLIKKPSLWSKYQPVLEKQLEDDLNVKCSFTENDTHTDRILYVKEHINMDNDILDYGCGEFRHLKKMNRDFEGIYYGLDLEDYSQTAEILDKRYDKIDVRFDTTLGNIPKAEPLSVIMSEVIEHNSVADGKKYIERVVNNYNVKQIVITTPNVDFNVHYRLGEGEMRHDDHVFEINYEAFVDYIKSLNFEKPIESIKFDKLSDMIDGVSVSSGVVINFK